MTLQQASDMETVSRPVKDSAEDQLSPPESRKPTKRTTSFTVDDILSPTKFARYSTSSSIDISRSNSVVEHSEPEISGGFYEF